MTTSKKCTNKFSLDVWLLFLFYRIWNFQSHKSSHLSLVEDQSQDSRIIVEYQAIYNYQVIQW